MNIDQLSENNFSKVSWFEFILDDTLLGKFLNNVSSTTSATDLISLFLYQVDISTTILKDIKNSQIPQPVTNENEDSKKSNDTEKLENNKVRKLKLFALTTACHIGWQLDDLHKNLPMVILQNLLFEYIRLTSRGKDISCFSSTSDLNINSLAPEIIFSLTLYHMWCLKSLVEESFPIKPSKVPNVQVPGLLDPIVSSMAQKETVLSTLRESQENSINFLLKVSQELKKDVKIATIECIQQIQIEKDTKSEGYDIDWMVGKSLSANDLICQVRYQLGCSYFLQRKYQETYENFSESKKKFQNTKENLFIIKIDESMLEGFIKACSGMLKKVSSFSKSTVAPNLVAVFNSLNNKCCLLERVEQSIENKLENLTGLLIEDITKQELTLAYRGKLEELALKTQRTDSLYEEVVICNTIRSILDGNLVSSFNFTKLINYTIGLVEFFIKVCSEIISHITKSQQELLKTFLRSLCNTTLEKIQFSDHLLKTNLRHHFDADELKCIEYKDSQCENKFDTKKVDISFNFTASDDETLLIANLEQELLNSYDIQSISSLVDKLTNILGHTNPNSKTALITLSDKWKLTKELENFIHRSQSIKSVNPIFLHILLAKGRLCLQMQMYAKAKELLIQADMLIKDRSFKFSKLIGWEILNVELCSYAEVSNTEIQHSQELIKKCRTCVSSHQLESNMQPSTELICLSIAYLLDAQDWDYLSNTNKNHNIINLGHLISTMCQELSQMKNVRIIARSLIEFVAFVFNQNMKINTGKSIAGILTPDLFLLILTRIKNETVLMILISCLTKLLNLACLVDVDNMEDIYSDHLSIWPSTLQSNNLNMDRPCLMNVVKKLLDYALSLNKYQSSWVRTQSDLSYAFKDHWNVLKFYLYLGVLTTDYFNEPIAKNIYDDQILKKMIHSCSELKCYTQAAVLCQFLEEVDYTVAFKCLQEKVSSDAMDAYYHFFWDVTILEFLINLHTKRGELDRRSYAIKLIGQLELNNSNRPDILYEAARIRKSSFMRSMTRLYLEN